MSTKPNKIALYKSNSNITSYYHTVLVFDSGVGGLLIYDKIRKLFPNLNYIYVFDNVAFPYGEKSEEFIVRRVIQIISALQKLYSLECVVIGCNTASTIAMSELHKAFSFPIVGVMPAIKPAIHLTKNRIIGLIATHRTIECAYTHKLVKQFSNKFHIKTLGSIELVKLAEKKMRGKVISLKSIYKILQCWLQISESPDTIILGCTHFPILKDELLAILPRGTHLIDASINTIDHITCFLSKNKFKNSKLKKLNIAYCTAFHLETEQILPVLLNQYGFQTLKKLEL